MWRSQTKLLQKEDSHSDLSLWNIKFSLYKTILGRTFQLQHLHFYLFYSYKSSTFQKWTETWMNVLILNRLRALDVLTKPQRAERKLLSAPIKEARTLESVEVPVLRRRDVMFRVRRTQRTWTCWPAALHLPGADRFKAAERAQHLQRPACRAVGWERVGSRC